MKLYSFGGGNTIIEIDVLKETPKGYKIDSRGWKFIRKSDPRWFPKKTMALQYLRDVLKKRILYAEEEVVKAQDRKAEREGELETFDSRYDIVADDGLSEESYWMGLRCAGKV